MATESELHRPSFVVVGELSFPSLRLYRSSIASRARSFRSGEVGESVCNPTRSIHAWLGSREAVQAAVGPRLGLTRFQGPSGLQIIHRPRSRARRGIGPDCPGIKPTAPPARRDNTTLCRAPRNVERSGIGAARENTPRGWWNVLGKPLKSRDCVLRLPIDAPVARRVICSRSRPVLCLERKQVRSNEGDEFQQSGTAELPGRELRTASIRRQEL